MAWHIHDSVIRGEMDNRTRGVVRGRIWLRGLTGPVALELQGNACPDLAGCLLSFENPGETIPLRTETPMHPLQRGTVGDLTASRKVRVFDLPFEDAYERLKQKLPVPEHMANGLYLEWFSEANGRIVIESVDYRLTLSPPAWKLTPAEEEQRASEAAAGFAGFMQKLSQAIESRRHEPPDDRKWDEFDYEKFLRESDARTDKYMELLDKYEGHPDAEGLVAREMGWETPEAEDGGDDVEPDEGDVPGATGDFQGDSGNELDVDEINRACTEAAEEPLEPDPATEGVDWVREEDGGTSHPLSLRAFNSSMALWHTCAELGLDKSEDDDLCRLISEFQITGAKLAGALDGLAYDRDFREGPFTVAYLKRALNHLHAAQTALEKVAKKNFLPADTVTVTRTELFAIREEILRLMTEFREEK